MKTCSRLTLFLTIIITLSSCTKFEEDKGIQFQKPQKRLTASTWKINRFMVNEIDSTAQKDSVFQSFPFRFFVDKDMAANNLMINYVRFGDWKINDDSIEITVWEDQAAIVAAHPGDSVLINHLNLLGGTYKVIKLSDQELKISRDAAPQLQIDMVGTKI